MPVAAQEQYHEADLANDKIAAECCGGGGRWPKEAMLCMITTPEGKVTLANQSKLGAKWQSLQKLGLKVAYVLPTQACLQKALAGGLAKALDTPLEEGFDQQLMAQLTERFSGLLGLARKAGALTPGVDNILTALKKDHVRYVFKATDSGKNADKVSTLAQAIEIHVFELLTKDQFSAATAWPNCAVVALTGKQKSFEDLAPFATAIQALAKTTKPTI